jgi:holo-[acyl-carrier protein] synthase
MTRGIGVDIVEVDRIKANIDRFPERFLQRLFTESEQAYCNKYGDTSHLHYAGRFAAKEAVSKSLGVGFGKSLGWLDIEILNDEMGKPVVTLSSEAMARFAGGKVSVSISHCNAYATAFALYE